MPDKIYLFRHIHFKCCSLYHSRGQRASPGIIARMEPLDLNKAALRGEPSYVWRAGQDRRLRMILHAAGERIKGNVLENGCGVGMYLQQLAAVGGQVFGLEYDFDRVRMAHKRSEMVTNAASEAIPFPAAAFDLILSHEVLEHVQDDRMAVSEIVRTLKVGGRLILFVPNRGYPFETHGIYWRGKYKFGNIPLINWLPRGWRDRLAPHVRVYTNRDIEKLFENLPVQVIQRTVIFGAYDNLIVRFGMLGKLLRMFMQFLEKTPFKALGLSQFWVVEKK
jgi:SAM-dependent methyltransferase